MSTGFFEKDETEVIRGDETLPVSKSPLLTATCKECGLYKACKSPKMNPTGEGKKRILILGENPGKNEDEQGMQFVGKSGQLLRNILKDMNLDLDRDFWKTNATCCHSINNETPTALQVVACRSRVMQCIKEYDPLVIIPLGKVAMDSLVGYRMIGRLSGLSMIDWVGCQIPDQELKRWICPTWHPSFILRNDNNGKEDIVLKKQMTQCIKMAVSIADNNAPFYISNYLSDCYSIETMDEAIDIIKQYQKKDLFAFDYETTGKKPHREGHEIISVSISDGLFSFAFPFFNDRNFRDEWKKLMLGNAQKIAHNAKFEVIWTKNRAGYNNTEGYWPNNIVWDTMLAAHIMDNKKKVNLKFQLYKLLGMAGYDNDIDPYLEAVKKDEEINGANAFNRIKEAPLNKLLLYNAMDSLGTFKLWEYQSRRMNPELKKGVDLFTRGSLALSHVEDNGIQFDEVQSEKSKIKIDKKMNVLEDLVFESKELKKWDREKPFRVSATGDLTHLLFDILDYKCLDEDRTITKRPKADANTMEKYRNVKVVDLTLDWRKWAKIRDTYLKGLTKESVNGVIHTVYGLHNIETFRSGSSSPNLQNQNKRDEEAAKVTRSLLKPRQGHKLGEYDYKSLEACLDGETLIETISGKMKIKDVVDKYNEKDIYVYCYDNEKKRIGVSKVISGKKTGVNKKVIKITLDNNESIIVTPNHKFMLRNGEYKEAKDLVVDESLMPFYSSIKHDKETGVNYKKINLNNGSKMLAHNLIAEDVFGVFIKNSNLLVHHKDHNGMNNDLDNIEIMDRKEHMKLHAIDSWTKPTKKRTFEYQSSEEFINKRKEGYTKWWGALSAEEKKEFTAKSIKNRRSMAGENNPMYGKVYTEEEKEKQRIAHLGQKGHPQSEENKEKLRIAFTGRIITEEWRNKIHLAKQKNPYHPTEETRIKIGNAVRGRIISEESKQKESKIRKEWWDNNEERKKKQSEEMKDWWKNNEELRKKRSDEKKEWWAEKNKNKPVAEKPPKKERKGIIPGEETRLKMSVAHKGTHHSEESKKRQSEIRKEWWSKQKLKNHKVLKIENSENSDVYNITVEDNHNYALAAGVIVKNCIIATYHKDPKWIEYVSSDKNDMHRDMGAKIFVKPKEEITKKERFVSKNGFVFPTIYGSWYKNTGTNIWNSIEDETKKHLRDVGIKNLNQFIEHMKEIEEWFWVDQFPVAYEWKEKTIHDYEKNGYVDLYTGFRCKGPMSINQLLNCQTQGTAFHCLLWTLTNVVNKMEKMKMDSRVIGEVHDSQLVDINTEEEDMVDHLIWLYGTQKIREHWDWLVVPLNIEKSVSKVNGSWAELKEVGMLTGE